eukprot:325563-Amphidinium_carterae.1
MFGTIFIEDFDTSIAFLHDCLVADSIKHFEATWFDLTSASVVSRMSRLADNLGNRSGRKALNAFMSAPKKEEETVKESHRVGERCCDIALAKITVVQDLMLNEGWRELNNTVFGSLRHSSHCEKCMLALQQVGGLLWASLLMPHCVWPRGRMSHDEARHEGFKNLRLLHDAYEMVIARKP